MIESMLLGQLRMATEDPAHAWSPDSSRACRLDLAAALNEPSGLLSRWGTTIQTPGNHFDDILCILSDCTPDGVGKLIGEIVATDLDRYAQTQVQIFIWLLKSPQPDALRLGLARQIWRAVQRANASAHPTALFATLQMHVAAHADAENLRRQLDEALTSPFDQCASILNAIAHSIRLPVQRFVILARTTAWAPASSGGTIWAPTPEWANSNQRPGIILPAIDELLGTYDARTSMIRLYLRDMGQCADFLRVSPEHLEAVVLIHEAAHAVVHLGTDADDRPFDTQRFLDVDSGACPSLLHEILAQLLTWWAIREKANLHETFSRLNQHQPNEYHAWEEFKNRTREQIRSALLEIRAKRASPTLDDFRHALR